MAMPWEMDWTTKPVKEPMPWDMKWNQSAPTSGVTEVPKGGVPQEVSSDRYARANILPLARNLDTGTVEPAVPGFLKSLGQAAQSAATLPGDVYTGKVDVNSPEAGQRAMEFSMLATPLSRASRVTAEAGAPATTEMLRERASGLYKQAEESGLNVKPTSYDRLVKGIVYKTKEEGLDQTLHPKAFGAIDRLVKEVEKPKTLQEIDTLRRVLGTAAKSREPDEGRIATIARDRLDDWLETLRPSDVLSGDAKAASQSIRQARKLWAQMRKSETFDDIQERALNRVGANYTQAELQTALRQEFKSLANNKMKMRGFSPEEQAAIRRIVRGGTMENILRFIGKFAPKGQLGTILSAGAGYSVGGPIGAVGLPVAGGLAKAASGNLGMRSVDRANALVRGY